ncbi:MAG TPA: efflux transporter outer membrane subunit [Phycisphaerae bacterium]|nr:efflux transporter outer membrane subunit [Phycisphaerae bacterium]
MSKRFVPLTVAVLFGVLSQGCEWIKNGFKVGPNYSPAPVPLANNWIDYQTPAATEPATQAATQPATQPTATNLATWWTVFNDPVLNSLMHDAYAQSLTLRAAGERIAAARANRDIAIGNLFPQTQQAAGAYTWNKSSEDTHFHNKDQWFQDSNVGLNFGWEIDFWGRYRRSLESSDASLDASIADYDNVMVILLSDVATNYVQYRTYQERLALAHQNVEIQRQAYELAQHNFNAGATTERDVQQARQAYEQTRALIPQFELGIRQANNAICVLLGIPVQDLSSRLGDAGIPAAPVEVAIGIPADLLRRRPDVREAERLAAAQSALIGVQEAALYPHFFINGTIGVNADSFHEMFHTPGSMAGGFGPSFQWDILNYGRLENAVTSQQAIFREFILRFQQTVLIANQEAEDAITSFAKSKEQADLESLSVAAAQRTVQITYDQYRHGAIDFTPVFIFETTLTQQQDSLAVTRGNIVLSVVNLYRSLGGGWEARLQPEGIVGPPTTAPSIERVHTGPEGLLMPTTTKPATNPS